jgi:hypothetical protein
MHSFPLYMFLSFASLSIIPLMWKGTYLKWPKEISMCVLRYPKIFFQCCKQIICTSFFFLCFRQWE